MLVPKLRFKREDGTDYPEWTKQKLSAVSSRVTRKNKGNITDIPLTIASLYGLVDQREYFKKKIASQNMEGYYLLHNGEFAYNKSHSKGFDFGAIKRLDRYDCGALSTLYICFAVNNKVDSDFMTHYFDSQKWNKEVSIRCAEGARNHGLLNISTNDFFDIDMVLPTDLEEQQKIADFLSNVDEVIAQSEAEVANLQQQKKAAMQKIFSQEVRFKREDGTSYPEWENVKFGSLIKEYRDRTSIENEDVLLSSAISGMFLNTELFGHQRGKSNIGYLKINYGTLILSAQNLHLGNANVNLRFEHGIISPAYKTYHITNCNLYFMAQWIKREKTNQFFYNATTVGASQCRRNVDWNALYKQSILIPHLEEQQKIADFLATYDEAISCAKQELDKWKELKKGLLQQMFA